ncbi:hypothetical protein PY092_01150 [Muricauda sp. 334s03]|uniref:Uncharacterized protein n=1 Tax=Flagellimonas yonaguniensis TaxID=3031325 RepID=A0ABT5XU79_9FLAO|nr:hypothetical protein [[Muricauda] yonaguniensis]MDF0714740.1 hypothetical protein [[Muricauda] yonaguniensis]
MKIENMIGKNLLNVPFEFKVLDSVGNSGSITYLITGAKQEFYTKPLKHILVKTDEEGVIKQLMTDFQGVVDEEFYRFLALEFGKADLMLKHEIETQRKVIQVNGTTSTETKSTLKKCGIGDDPLFIIWDNPELKMMLSIIRESNRTELTIGDIPFTKDTIK